MIEKLRAALQSIDLTQIIIAAAGGLGGAALWAQKRYKWITIVQPACSGHRCERAFLVFAQERDHLNHPVP